MKKTEIRLVGADKFFTKEAYKGLCSNICLCGDEIQAIAVTSCNDNEGKTTVALNTAKSFSELGKKVLFIDADMRKPNYVDRNSAFGCGIGLSEILSGTNKYSECACATQYRNLHILFSGNAAANPAELLSEHAFSVFLRKARNVYDYIFIDTPPACRVVDAEIVARECDGTIFVLGEKTRLNRTLNTIERFRQNGCRILGVIRNKSKKSRKNLNDFVGVNSAYDAEEADVGLIKVIEEDAGSFSDNDDTSRDSTREYNVKSAAPDITENVSSEDG